MTYYGIVGLPELDKLIISYIDINEFGQLVRINSCIKNLIIKLLPSIVEKYYCVKYEDDLYSFGLDLIIFKQFDVLSNLMKIYDELRNM